MSKKLAGKYKTLHLILGPCLRKTNPMLHTLIILLFNTIGKLGNQYDNKTTLKNLDRCQLFKIIIWKDSFFRIMVGARSIKERVSKLWQMPKYAKPDLWSCSCVPGSIAYSIAKKCSDIPNWNLHLGKEAQTIKAKATYLIEELLNLLPSAPRSCMYLPFVWYATDAVCL